MYVQAINNLWYKNPTIMGHDYMVICAEGEIPVLYAKYGSSRSHLRSTWRKINNRLRLDGVFLSPVEGTAEETMCLFGTKTSIAAKWDVSFCAPIPIPATPWHVERPGLHSSFVGWKLDFPRKEILDHVAGIKISLMIAEFVLERRLISENVITEGGHKKIDLLLHSALTKEGDNILLEKKIAKLYTKRTRRALRPDSADTESCANTTG